MIQTEREVERRIAVPRAFCVEEYGTVGAAQNIFRADVAVHERELGAAGDIDEPLQLLREIGMRARRRGEIRLEADRKEDVIGRERLREVGTMGRVRMLRLPW